MKTLADLGGQWGLKMPRLQVAIVLCTLLLIALQRQAFYNTAESAKIVIICINQHTTFEMPSFIDFKDMIGGQNIF